MGRCSPHCELLQHIRRVQQVHVLVETCCGPTTAPCLLFDVGVTTLFSTTGSFLSCTVRVHKANTSQTARGNLQAMTTQPKLQVPVVWSL